MVETTTFSSAPAIMETRVQPPLVPRQGEIQHGYELSCRELSIGGSTVRLFTVPGGSPEVDRTMLCLPGMGTSGRSFAPMAPLASQLRFLFWTPPLKTPMHRSPLAHNLGLLVSPEAPLPERFFLLGSSYGALIALVFALRCPERVRALVLAGPVASSHRIRRATLAASVLMRAPPPLAYALAPTIARVLGGPELPPEARAELIRESRRVTSIELGRRLGDVLETDLLPELPRLRVPTLIVHGGRDRVVSLAAAEDLAARIPKARLEIIPGAAHLPYMSHPGAFNHLVREFLLHRPA